MNLDKAEWNWVLLSTLKRISKAYAVAFDLELSGIPTRKGGRDRRTLQDRYTDVKEAAEKYHILQLGLTLVEEDAESEQYVLRSYNIPLTPLCEEYWGLDRNFTYSSGAVEFLLRNGYRMESPFGFGIPYLTKAEDPLARQNYLKRFDRMAIPDVVLKDTEVENLALIERVKDEVEAWLAKKKNDDEVYEFSGSPSGAKAGGGISDEDRKYLRPFERRLVHQTVRNTFPDLRTFYNDGAITVATKDSKQEEREREFDQTKLKQNFFHQWGVRFITEGLAGGDWADKIDTGFIGRVIEGEGQYRSTTVFKERISQLEQELKDHRTILVGHNCFLDLVYIYHNFYGPLPNTVGEFQEALHKIFPTIIDTKYLSTVGGDEASRRIQLYELVQGLAGQREPAIEAPHDHPSYLETEESYHQAGYDSYQTAKVFLKLSHTLENDGEYLLDESSDTAFVGTSTPLVDGDSPPSTRDGETGESSVVKTREKKKKRKNKNGSQVTASKFTSTNPYDNLSDAAEEDTTLEETPISSSNPAGPVSEGAVNDPLASKLRSLSLSHQNHQKRRNNRNLLPPWDTDFWRVYGNKLRVFGTLEEVCDLTSPAQAQKPEASGSSLVESKETSSPVKEREVKADNGRSGLLGGLRRFLSGS